MKSSPFEVLVLVSLATNAIAVSVDVRGNEAVSVTALDPETQTSSSTTVLPGLNNAVTNWYNDGMVVSNISHSAVVTETRYDALCRETARIDGRGNVSRTRYDAIGRVAETIDALTNATAYAYDAMGRRVMKNDQCFVYDGYLQVANHHSTTTTSNYNYQSTPTPPTYTYFTWDPTEPVATRPLVCFNSALDTPRSALYYTHDGNKNVSVLCCYKKAKNEIHPHFSCFSYDFDRRGFFVIGGSVGDDAI